MNWIMQGKKCTIPTTMESYSEGIKYFIAKFDNRTINQIYLIVVNLVF